MDFRRWKMTPRSFIKCLSPITRILPEDYGGTILRSRFTGLRINTSFLKKTKAFRTLFARTNTMESVHGSGLDAIQEMDGLIKELYPICRSITGNGARQTLQIIQRRIPLSIHEVPSGTQVFDWTVPKEWNIRDAFIKNPQGEKVVDFAKSNLHVVSYSTAFRGKLSLDELKQHLFTLPDRPQWIPYRTSYYKETWGFCLSHEQLASDGRWRLRSCDRRFSGKRPFKLRRILSSRPKRGRISAFVPYLSSFAL